MGCCSTLSPAVHDFVFIGPHLTGFLRFQGFTVRLVTQQRSLQEFLVQCHTEWARVGRKSVVFHLAVETLIIAFATVEDQHKFHSMLASVRLELTAHTFLSA